MSNNGVVEGGSNVVGNNWMISNNMIDNSVNSLSNLGDVINSFNHIGDVMNSWYLSNTLDNLWHIHNSLSLYWNHFNVVFDMLSIDGDVVNNVLDAMDGSGDWNSGSDGSGDWHLSSDGSGHWVDTSNIVNDLLNMVDSNGGNGWGSMDSE